MSNLAPKYNYNWRAANVNQKIRCTLKSTIIFYSIFQRTPLSPVPTVITDERFNLLCPQPKHIQQLSDAYSEDLNYFPDGMTISISSGDFSVHE